MEVVDVASVACKLEQSKTLVVVIAARIGVTGEVYCDSMTVTIEVTTEWIVVIRGSHHGDRTDVGDKLVTFVSIVDNGSTIIELAGKEVPVINVADDVRIRVSAFAG